MARKFEIQLKEWIPLIIDAYYTYETLNTHEIVKSSVRLRSLEPKEQVDEILNILKFLEQSKLLVIKKQNPTHYFGTDFTNTEYEVTQKFLDLAEQSIQNGVEHKSTDIITSVKIESTTNNTFNFLNFNLTFMLEKLLEIKAALLNV